MTTIAQWEAFTEATLTRQDAAKRTGRELAAQTPPVKLARRARHRKPNRRRHVWLPLWAGALLITLAARHEMDAATAAQLAEIAGQS